MRIFLIIHPSGNQSVPGSLTWYRNMYEPLIDLGEEVVLIRLDILEKDWGASFRTPAFKEKLNKFVLEKFKLEQSKKKIDLFLSYLTDLDISETVINNIKSKGTITANFSCNNTHQFHLIQKISPSFDFNLHSEKSASEKFRKIGANPVWFQLASNPKYYRPFKINKIYDVSFIGMNYARRAEYIKHLFDNNIPVNCFGPGWTKNDFFKRIKKQTKRIYHIGKTLFSSNTEKKLIHSASIKDQDLQDYISRAYVANMHPPVTDDGMIQIFSQSKINLGFLEVYAKDNQAGSGILQHLHLREFEVPMSGGLYFTNYSDELAEHYEPDKEVVIYRNEHELLDKVRYYLNHENEAEKIRKAGLKRSLNCHTYQKRFENLFRELHLK